MSKAPKPARKPISIASARLKAEGVKRDSAGRPTKIDPTDDVLKIVEGLGNIMATGREAAAVLGVTEVTFLKFLKDNPVAEATFERGQGTRLVSLRRQQLKSADAGNIAALIWLGKQYLGQRDKSDVAIDARVEMGGAAAALAEALDRALDVAAAHGADGASEKPRAAAGRPGGADPA